MDSNYIISATKPQQFPEHRLPEFAFVGRSNCGKSSLLNHLTQNKKLAHVSSKPGKTQLINFFSIDDNLTLVDLPGYGFAKISKSIREAWGNLIQEYLEKRERLSLILLLIDLRHPPSQEDLLFAKWAVHYQKPLCIIFTKADKLKSSAIPKHVKTNLALLSDTIGDTPVKHIVYSIKDPKARKELVYTIQNHLEGKL